MPAASNRNDEAVTLDAIRATAARTELNSVCNSSSALPLCAPFLLLFHGNPKTRKDKKKQRRKPSQTRVLAAIHRSGAFPPASARSPPSNCTLYFVLPLCLARDRLANFFTLSAASSFSLSSSFKIPPAKTRSHCRPFKDGIAVLFAFRIHTYTISPLCRPHLLLSTLRVFHFSNIGTTFPWASRPLQSSSKVS